VVTAAGPGTHRTRSRMMADMRDVSESERRSLADSARPAPVFRTAALFLVTACLALGSCTRMKLEGPDLGEIYNRAARHHSSERNPIIVIPGILGTKLVDDGTGKTVWGAFSGEYARPGTAGGARLVALPMQEGAALSELVDGVRPDGVLDRVRVRVAGVPVQVLAYFHILGALGAGGYRDQELGLSGAIDYGDEHFTCFQFGYDWRRDISETAVELGKFIEQKREYVKAEMERRYGVVDPDVRFDIVAHSMGGLVARYYLRYGGNPLPEDGSLPELTWAGARDLENVILVGAPNAGSVKTLDELVRGVKVGPMLPRYGPAIVGTMPAAYQLLPRERHRAVAVDDTSGPRFLDPHDPAVWEEMGWGLASTEVDETLEWLLPDVPDNAERRRVALDHLRKSLRRARQFAEAMDVPASPPAGTSLYLMAGDSEPTSATAEVEPASGALRISETRPGDGTVLRSSALMDERLSGDWSPRLVSPIDWSQVIFLFHDHLELTRSQEFTDNVLFLLLEKQTQLPE